MSLRHLIIRLRVLLTLVIVVGILGTVGGLFYFHEKGLNDNVTARVAKEMERYGIFTEFDHLSFHLIHGLRANNVAFYRTAQREVKIATLPTLAIHVDKTKMMRGILKINTVSVEKASLAIPLVTGFPNSPVIEVSELSGSIDLPGSQSVSTTDLTGVFQGIEVTLSCNVWREKPKKSLPQTKAQQLEKIASYQEVLAQISSWKWPKSTPPKLAIFIEGNLSKTENIDFEFVLEAPSLQYKNYPMENVKVEGDWNQNLITLDELSFTNQAEKITVTSDFDIIQKSGRFKVDSKLHLQNFSNQVFGKRIMQNYRGTGQTHLIASGNYRLPIAAQGKLDINLIGKVESKDFSFQGASVDSLKADFSWNNGDLYLDNIDLQHALGKVTGRLIIKDRLIRYAMVSSLPAQVYFPFIKSQQLTDYLAKISFTEKSYIDVHSSGSLNQDNLREWDSRGHAELRNFKKNGVPIRSATGKYALNLHNATFSDITATFDYSNYPLKTAYNGPQSGTLSAKELYFDWSQKLAQIEQIRGSAWPAPVLNLFAPKIGKHLGQYRFHLPPTLDCSGDVSWQQGAANKTNLTIDFSTTGTTDYRFLKKDVPLENVRAQVRVLPDKVEINKLSSKACSGSLAGNIQVTPTNSNYSGNLTWSKNSLKELGEIYQLKGFKQGAISGSFRFSGNANKLSSLNGSGALSLADGDLFAVPLFGPLSSLIDGVLSTASTRDTVLHEKATDFTCSYTAKNGVFYTNNLSCMTPNTVFTGEGWIDTNKQDLDLTIRMNFRGLMGLAEVPMKLIELPFQALNKIFTGRDVEGMRQFHGTGKLSAPNWQFTPFKPPPGGKNNPLFRKPSKAQIVE